MRTRRHAREAVLQALFQMDAQEEWSAECLELYFAIYQGDEVTSDQKEIFAFARSLAHGVLQSKEQVDSVVARTSRHWTLDRMGRVDRNILRLATFELGACGDIPVNVTLNEAIELAKMYGADDSRTFVNGILDRVASDIQKGAFTLPHIEVEPQVAAAPLRKVVGA